MNCPTVLLEWCNAMQPGDCVLGCCFQVLWDQSTDMVVLLLLWNIVVVRVSHSPFLWEFADSHWVQPPVQVTHTDRGKSQLTEEWSSEAEEEIHFTHCQHSIILDLNHPSVAISCNSIADRTHYISVTDIYLVWHFTSEFFLSVLTEWFFNLINGWEFLFFSHCAKRHQKCPANYHRSRYEEKYVSWCLAVMTSFDDPNIFLSLHSPFVCSQI